MAEDKSVIIYDWVSISFKKHKPADIINLLGLESLSFQEIKGAHGYRDRFYCDCISIHYNGREDMGTWLEMSGKGCRVFEKFGNGDYDRLLGMCMIPDNKMNLTRLDIAFDDYDGLLDIDRICDDTKDGNVVTRFHETSWSVFYTGKGNSVLLGSRKSEILIRIYDKAAEQGIKDKHWIRTELQLRNDRAYGFVKAADTVRGIGDRFRAVLSNYVRYVVPGEDSNKRRWEITEYWDDLLQAAKAISIYHKPEIELTYEKLENYVVRQCGNAIAAYIKLRDITGFVEEINGRNIKPNPKYDDLVKKMMIEPAPRVATPEDQYNDGYEEVMYKVFGDYDERPFWSLREHEEWEKNIGKKEYKIVRDLSGKRWLKCEECGFIKRENECSRLGSELGVNYGLCRDCEAEKRLPRIEQKL